MGMVSDNRLKEVAYGESRNANSGDSGDFMTARKSAGNEGKKRSWDDFITTNKPGQDQERRPNKRRQNEGRNRRGNRNKNKNPASRKFVQSFYLIIYRV